MLLRPVFDEESESAIRFGPFLHPDSVLTQTPHTFRTSPVALEGGMVILEFARIVQLEVSAHAGDVGGTLG